MSDRDELIELIDGLQDVGRSRAYMIADAILKAGWRAPEQHWQEDVDELYDWQNRHSGGS